MERFIVIFIACLITMVNADIEQQLAYTDYSIDLRPYLREKIIEFIISTDLSGVEAVDLAFNISRLDRNTEFSDSQDADEKEDGFWLFTFTDVDIQAADQILFQVKFEQNDTLYASDKRTQLLLAHPPPRPRRQDGPHPDPRPRPGRRPAGPGSDRDRPRPDGPGSDRTRPRRDGPGSDRNRPRPDGPGSDRDRPRPEGPGSGRTRPIIETPFGLRNSTTTMSWVDRFSNSPEQLEFFTSCVTMYRIDRCRELWNAGMDVQSLLMMTTQHEEATTTGVTTSSTTTRPPTSRRTRLPPARLRTTTKPASQTKSSSEQHNDRDGPEDKNELTQTTIIIIATVVPFIVMSGLVVFACIIIRRRKSGSSRTAVTNAGYQVPAFKEVQHPPPPHGGSDETTYDLYEQPDGNNGYYDMYEVVKEGHEQTTPRRLSTFDPAISETDLTESNRPLPNTPPEFETATYSDSGLIVSSRRNSQEEYDEGQLGSGYMRTRPTDNGSSKLSVGPGSGSIIDGYRRSPLSGPLRSVSGEGYTVGGPDEDDTYQDLESYERPLPRRPDEGTNYETLMTDRRDSFVSLY